MMCFSSVLYCVDLSVDGNCLLAVVYQQLGLEGKCGLWS